MHAAPGVGQIQSVSVLQSGEQPSPPARLPSSHVSAGGLSMPLPHGFGLQDPGGPSHDVSGVPPPPRSGVPTSRGLSVAASITGGPPPWPPLPVVLLLETPAHPAQARAASKPSRAFTP